MFTETHIALFLMGEPPDAYAPMGLIDTFACERHVHLADIALCSHLASGKSDDF